MVFLSLKNGWQPLLFESEDSAEVWKLFGGLQNKLQKAITKDLSSAIVLMLKVSINMIWTMPLVQNSLTHLPTPKHMPTSTQYTHPIPSDCHLNLIKTPTYILTHTPTISIPPSPPSTKWLPWKHVSFPKLTQSNLLFTPIWKGT